MLSCYLEPGPKLAQNVILNADDIYHCYDSYDCSDLWYVFLYKCSYFYGMGHIALELDGPLRIEEG